MITKEIYLNFKSAFGFSETPQNPLDFAKIQRISQFQWFSISSALFGKAFKPLEWIKTAGCFIDQKPNKKTKSSGLSTILLCTQVKSILASLQRHCFQWQDKLRHLWCKVIDNVKTTFVACFTKSKYITIRRRL